MINQIKLYPLCTLNYCSFEEAIGIQSKKSKNVYISGIRSRAILPGGNGTFGYKILKRRNEYQETKHE